MTGLDPLERFANHKSGIKAASVVRRYGLRLLSELYDHLNPMLSEAAAQMEVTRPKTCAGRGTRLLVALMAQLEAGLSPKWRHNVAHDNL